MKPKGGQNLQLQALHHIPRAAGLPAQGLLLGGQPGALVLQPHAQALGLARAALDQGVAGAEPRVLAGQALRLPQAVPQLGGQGPRLGEQLQGGGGTQGGAWGPCSMRG